MSRPLKRFAIALLVLMVIILLGNALYHHWQDILYWLYDIFRKKMLP